jgi:ABC-type branched-subunit amino acid transport system substrate-binding protein
MKRVRISAGVIAACCAVIALAACGSSDDDESTGATGGRGGASAPGVTASTIKLGVSDGLTGLGAAQCGPMADGQKAWFKHVNDQGGVEGRKIEYTVLDDGLDPTRAAANARRLVQQEGVFALMGSCSGAGNGAIVPYAEAQKVPFVAPYGGTIEQIDPHKEWVFSTFPLYETQLATMVNWAFDKNGPGSAIGLSYTDTPLWQQQVVKAVEDGGGKYLGMISFKVGQPSFGSEVLKIKAQNPDYILFNGSATDAARLVKEMARINYRPGKLILSTGVMADQGYVSGTSGSFADGLSAAASPFVLPSDPVVADCAKALGIPQSKLNSFQIYGCSSAQIMVAALTKAGKDLTRDQLRDVLTNGFDADVPGLAGGKATSAADNILSHALKVVGVKDHQLAYVQDEAVEAAVYGAK